MVKEMVIIINVSLKMNATVIKKNISTTDEGTQHLGWWYVTRLHLQVFGCFYGPYCEGLNKK